jgi:hypothetical protein
MRQSAFLLGVALFLAGTASAQTTLDSTPAADSPAASNVTISQETITPQLFALSTDPSGIAPATPAASSTLGANTDPASAQGPAPQTQSGGVQSVFPQYNWQAYVGYTYLRFYEGGPFTKNTNGLNIAGEYYPHTGHLGIDGEAVATFGSQANRTLKLWAGMGGGRYRFAAPRGLEVWVHGLVGGAKFVPQTAFGGQTGLAYEVGAGVDIGAFNHRLAFRFAGDMLGTRFFSTGQYNPKVSAGIVFKY